MNMATLSEKQKEALMDLLVVGMYADRNLASAEDLYALRLLKMFEFSSEEEQRRFYDGSFARASRHTGSAEAMNAYVKELSASFSTRESRQNVFEILLELLRSDGKLTAEESELLSSLKQVFAL